jgi:hypothetical protein
MIVDMDEKVEKQCLDCGKRIEGDGSHCDECEANRGKDGLPEVSHTPWRAVPYKERNLPLVIVSVVTLVLLVAIGIWGAFYLYDKYGPGADQTITASLSIEPNDDPYQMLIQVSDVSRSRDWSQFELIVYIDDSMYSAVLGEGLIDLRLDTEHIGYNFYLVDTEKNDRIDKGDYILVTNPIEPPGIHITIQLMDRESASILSTLHWTSD